MHRLVMYRRGRVVAGFTTTYSVPIITNVVNSNLVHVLDTTICDQIKRLSVTCGMSLVFVGYSHFHRDKHHNTSPICV